jgi:shikimate kinase
VIAARAIQNIALVGFMGVGKSSVGRQLAQDLGFEFVDTDELIEERTGMKIPEIFATAGEPQFRQLEAKLLEEMRDWNDRVIATGGGLITHGNNLELLKENSLVVCLWASPEAIHERTKHQLHRPLLQTDDPLGKIRSLLEAREGYYKRADVLVSTELRSIREISVNIVHQFRASQRD